MYEELIAPKNSDKLPFKIGEQFELNEFNLESLNSEFHNGIEYEVYKYIKEDVKTLFGFKVSNIRLYYNTDILLKVVYEFENPNQKRIIQE